MKRYIIHCPLAESEKLRGFLERNLRNYEAEYAYNQRMVKEWDWGLEIMTWLEEDELLVILLLCAGIDVWEG